MVATNAVITTDDVADPPIKVRAKYIKIIPGQSVRPAMRRSTWRGSRSFYFPYYSRNLGPHANNFNFVPGYRTQFGPFLLSNYKFFLNDQLDGIAHVDYREKRGPGVGPDLNYHFGRWGEGPSSIITCTTSIRAWTRAIPTVGEPAAGGFSYLATPAPIWTSRSVVRYQSDTNVVPEFFEREYRQDPQPNTFFEANRYLAEFQRRYLRSAAREQFPRNGRAAARRAADGPPPAVVGYPRSITRARARPAIIGGTSPGPPTACPPGPNYEAARADTYHKLLLPQTFFGWLNVTPARGRPLTYYSQPPARGDHRRVNRGVFNTGAEVSFKASRLWPEAQSSFFQVDGLRHIIQPSVNYAYSPSPNVYGTNQIPQFDYELPSLRLLPITIPGLQLH